MRPFLALSFILCFLVAAVQAQPPAPAAENTAPVRRINVPFTTAVEPNIPVPDRAVLWFGQVTATQNYADLRAIYNNEKLHITIHTFDKQLWYDSTAPVEDLNAWDTMSLYINTSGNSGFAPTTTSYLFISQLKQNNPRTGYDAVYKGNGTTWVPTTVSGFEAVVGWRGSGINDNGASKDDRGWNVTFRIPYAGLGLSKPAEGTVWGMAAVVHDRDDATGTAIPNIYWPDGLNTNAPSTWGQLGFGLPSFTPQTNAVEGVTTLKNGVNGVSVADADVGGGSLCGAEFGPEYFSGWGSANYAGDTDFNVQNQWDVADWPCFSKYFVTFPLDSIPAEAKIYSATLKIYQFGNAGDPAGTCGVDAACPSWIQVFSVGQDWSENSLTWNTAPLALQNWGGTWVNPLAEYPGLPGVPAHLSVSQAVATAFANGEPARLALYSADGERHSGKYFASSDGASSARPTLRIAWAYSDVTAVPAITAVAPGETAHYAIHVPVFDAGVSDVALSVSGLPAELTAVFVPANLTAPGTAVLQITDHHSGTIKPGLFYTFTLTASGNGYSQQLPLGLLVGGNRNYLPIGVKQ